MAGRRFTPSLDASPNLPTKGTTDDRIAAPIHSRPGPHRRATSRRGACPRHGGRYRAAQFARGQSHHPPDRSARAPDRAARALMAMRLHGSSTSRAAEAGHVLADGTRLLLRPLSTDDRPGLAALFARLTPES